MNTGFTIIFLLFAELITILLVLLIAGLLSLTQLQFLTVFKWGLWALVLPPVLFAYGHVIGINRIVINQEKIVSERVPEAFVGYKVVHISDWHLESFGRRHAQLEKIVTKINSLEPDIIVFSGDLVTYSPEEIVGCDSILSRLKARDGVYSVLGNHDYCIYSNLEEKQRLAQVAKVVEHQKNMGWKVLMNENVVLRRDSSTEKSSTNDCSTDSTATASEIVLAGIQNTSTNPRFPSYGNLAAAMDGVEDRFCILASHDPSYWRPAIEQYPGIDLTLSGHTHAMQLSLFGFSPSRFIYPEYRGLYSESGHYLYVNIGLGETGILSRVGTPPEITLLELARP